jgi:hypothetical protein
VAVYRTLGIGLGFNFDHMSKLKVAEVPSIRRLQSRAAKSAVKRVGEIYNTQFANTILDQITDPIEREKIASSIRHDAETELKTLADRLANLIPNDLSWDDTASGLKIEQYNSGSFMRSSSANQYVIPSLQTESLALRRLFAEFHASFNQSSALDDIDYLDPMSTNEKSFDDEFVSEWYKENRISKSARRDNLDDQENSIETFLV